MQEPQKHRPGSVGKQWRQYAAGDPSDRPLAEWVYFTPRFPGGIGVVDLRDASPLIQRETALTWFGLNLEPYSLAGGPWFGFSGGDAPPSGGRGAGGYGIGGFGSGAFAPTPLEAPAVLREEFGLLPPALMDDVAGGLPGQWMWRRNPGPLSIEGQPLPRNWSEASAAILAKLDAFEAALRELRPAPGEIGHNMPPDEFTLTPRDEREAVAAIAKARAAVSRGEEGSAAELRATAASARVIGNRFAAWALGQLDTFVTEANKSLAKRVGTLAALWLASRHLGDLVALLEHAATLVRH